jgi:DNA-binding LytR/AlgR family response regulator
MTLNCLVIDDEPLARAHIEGYIARTPFLKLAGSARNAAIACDVLDNEAIDLIFLDIKMPQTTGIGFLQQRDIFQQVVMITAFPEFAIDGFELNVADYLVKPVTFERFTKAVERACSRISGFEHIRKFNHDSAFIYVKNGPRYEKVNLDEILYIESMLNYIHIITAKKRLTVYSSMKNAADILPKELFAGVH